MARPSFEDLVCLASRAFAVNGPRRRDRARTADPGSTAIASSGVGRGGATVAWAGATDGFSTTTGTAGV